MAHLECEVLLASMVASRTDRGARGHRGADVSRLCPRALWVAIRQPKPIAKSAAVGIYIHTPGAYFYCLSPRRHQHVTAIQARPISHPPHPPTRFPSQKRRDRSFSEGWRVWRVPAVLACRMEFVIPGCKPEPKPRLCSSKVRLRFAALYPDELDFDVILDACKSWGATRGGLREYAIRLAASFTRSLPTRRKTSTSTSTVRTGRRRTSTIASARPSSTSLAMAAESYIPRCRQGVGRYPSDRERVLRYDIKDGDYVSELHTPLVEDAKRDAAEEDDEEEAEEEDGGGGEKQPGCSAARREYARAEDHIYI